MPFGEPPYLARYAGFFERVEKSVDILKAIDSINEYEGFRSTRVGRKTWTISPSVLIKIPSVGFFVGPFYSDTHTIARYGWGIRIDQNYVSRTVRAKILFNGSEKSERMNFSVKWNSSRVYDNVSDAWKDFIFIMNSDVSRNVTKNLSDSGRVVWMSKDGSKDPLEAIVRQRGEHATLKVVGSIAKESLDGWRPSRPQEKAIDAKSVVDDWMRNWREEDEAA